MARSLFAVFVNRMLVTYGAGYPVSAFGIINRIVMFAAMPAILIGQGLQPELGFDHGAKLYEKPLNAIKMAIAAATSCSVAVFVVLYFVPELVTLY